MEKSIALALASDVATFIESQRLGTETGGWRRTPDGDASPDASLYHGSAGIILFLLELAAATEDASLLSRAETEGHMLAEYLRAKQWASVSFATGWSGYSFVMQTLADKTGNESFRDVATLCLDRLMAQSQKLGTGIGWIEAMPFSDITGKTGDREIYDLSVGAAGAGLGMLHAHRGSVHPRALEWATSIGDRLLEVAEQTHDGHRWGLMSDMPFPFTAPNFAHGGAGVGYFMAQLFDATGDGRYLDAATSAARYVMTRSKPVGEDGGVLVCHTEEQQPPMFYLGECHGPAGTWRLFQSLDRLTNDESWGQYATKLLAGIAGLGAPHQRSDGWWKNHGQCCGDAGLGDTALAMHAATNNPAYLALAMDCATVIARAAQRTGGGVSWEQAEHRARPKFLQSQTGFMQGAAGIGSFLVHLATHESENNVRILFPDEYL